MEQVVQLIQKAVNGEYNATKMYECLATLAPNEVIHDRICEIREDEMRHLQLFTTIFQQLTGQFPHYNLAENMPTSFNEGIHVAFRDEQETSDFYRALAEQVPPYFQQAVWMAAADEQNHAVWFLYFITCKH